MNLKLHLEDLRTMRSKLSFLINEVEAAIHRQDIAPVKTFEDHWKSMGSTIEPVSQADGHAEMR